MKRSIRILCIALLSVVGLVGSSLQARADGHSRCERDVHKAEENLRIAIEKHGEHSRQAEKRRHELEDVRHRCHWEEHH